jgi:B9 domain-containing protein 1
MSKIDEGEENEDGRQSNLINNNSMVSEQNSLISDKNGPKRPGLSQEDHKKITDTVNRALAVGKEDIMNFQEISIKKSLFFRLFVSGTIEYGNLVGEEPTKIKYEFVSGESWEKEDGFSNGITQYSCKGEGLYNYYSFGQYFEISYRSINPFGWPQLVLNCFTIDSDGNEIVKGYGCVHVPTSIGRHMRKVHIFKSTDNSNFWDKFFGTHISSGNEKNNEVTNPKVISSGQEREISRTSCEGFVNVIFQVVFRDVEKFGLIIK